MEIAQRFLIPKTSEACNVNAAGTNEMAISEEALEHLISEY